MWISANVEASCPTKTQIPAWLSAILLCLSASVIRPERGVFSQYLRSDGYYGGDQVGGPIHCYTLQDPTWTAVLGTGNTRYQVDQGRLVSHHKDLTKIKHFHFGFQNKNSNIILLFSIISEWFSRQCPTEPSAEQKYYYNVNSKWIYIAAIWKLKKKSVQLYCSFVQQTHLLYYGFVLCSPSRKQTKENTTIHQWSEQSHWARQ